MKTIYLLAAMTAIGMTAAAQDEVETMVSADVVNQYIWRGMELGNVSLQPSVGVAYKGVELIAWGSVGLTDAADTKEFDLTASYTVGGLNIGVTDYWFDAPQQKYFLYDAHRTSHVFEAFVNYDFGLMSASWYTNFAGNDGLNKDGERAYSSYFELSAPFRLGGTVWTATVGAVPFATTSYDTDGFAVTNLSLKATKDIKVSDTFSVPLFGQIVGNPRTQDAFLVIGFTLRP
ncbi:MAG: hypothetical protein J5486_11130 [Bacteroidaceae bacterium]|nr:hypothetical protein [Bacteroidaceae bacterium]